MFGLFFVLSLAGRPRRRDAVARRRLPPAAMGAIVAVIGLELAPVATSMAGLTGDGSRSPGTARRSPS